MFSILVILLLSYLVGSIPSSVWIGRMLYGIDVRAHGSGNAGATNAFRVLGWKAGLLSTLIDVGKGLFAAGVIATLRFGPVPDAFGPWDAATAIRLMAGVAAVAGHMYPVWAHFKGGKGVNTSAGVLFALTPISMWITLLVFVVVLLVSRYVSLASLLAAITFPTTIAIRRYLFHIDALDPSLLIFGVVLATGIVYAHRANIRRLLQGEESRVRSFRPGGGLRAKGQL